MNGEFSILYDGFAEEKDVLFNDFEVTNWIKGSIDALVDSLEVDLGPHSLASCKARDNLLDSCNRSNNSTDGISITILFLGGLEFLDGNIKHNSSQIFIIEKGIKIEISSESFEYSLHDLSNLVFVLHGHEFLSILSEEFFGHQVDIILVPL